MRTLRKSLLPRALWLAITSCLVSIHQAASAEWRATATAAL